MKKHSNFSILGWHKFTVIGWILVGFFWWSFRHVYPRTELVSALLFGGYLTILALFQAVPMNRVFRGSWLWAVVGILAGLLAVYIRGDRWSSMHNFYGITFAGLALSFATAFVFFRLQSQHEETQPVLAEAEGS